MTNIVICDDESTLRNALSNVLETELQLMDIAYKMTEFDSGESLLRAKSIEKIDIIFLDVEMKEINGMETAKRFRRINKTAVIIFVTSYPDFVFQGYEVKALNYILKPYKDKKIIEVLHLALEELSVSTEHYYVIEQKSGSIKLSLKDVLYFYSDKRYICAVTINDTVRFYGKLNETELELPEFFVRIHNRYLINIHYITSIESASVVCGGDTLPVSRAFKQDLAVAFARKILQ